MKSFEENMPRLVAEPVPVRKDLAPCEVRSASVEVKKPRQFVIRNSAFAISRADIGKEHADTFRHVQHPNPALRDADYVLANPPFNFLN